MSLLSRLRVEGHLLQSSLTGFLIFIFGSGIGKGPRLLPLLEVGCYELVPDVVF